jgi:hypothetical protein
MNANQCPTIYRAAAVAAIVILFGSVGSIQGQMPPAAAGARQPPRPMMIDESQAAAMMAERQKMMAAMHALDRTLDDLIAKIDTARGDGARIDAIVAVLKQMTAQRTSMREQMMAMQGRMMGHMMEHMTAMPGMSMNRGQAGAAPSMMGDCPIMTDIVKESTAPGHEEHHPQK